MKLSHILTAACTAALLAACQPPAATTEPAPEAAAPSETAAAPAPDTAALPCGVQAQRNWSAVLSTGAPTTLTVAGEVDLGAPGYGVSLARADSAAEPGVAQLTLSLRAPTTPTTQVVTPHPVRYFAPANGEPTSVRVTCDGATLTEIPVTRG